MKISLKQVFLVVVPGFLSACRQYQRDSGLTVIGRPTAKLLARLQQDKTTPAAAARARKQPVQPGAPAPEGEDDRGDLGTLENAPKPKDDDDDLGDLGTFD